MIRFSFAFSFFVLFTISSYVFGQGPLKDEKSGGYRLPYILEGEDTIPVVNLPIVNIIDVNSPEYLKNLQAYYRLRFNVIKVYPYARLAAVKLNEMELKMASMNSDREKKRYRKTVEEQVRKDFEEQIKKLSINQGNVLIKLIDRETGHTSYDLIKQLKGSFNAFFAQGLAKLFGHDLKDEYDPEGEDKTIEMIVKQIENGQIVF
ncbi:MAG TPA: DUF4294 domain-containing protein [Bacteroidia bacterium]|nr:DUF4294 domain-containing protein [Bacteroidia bacterium]